MEMNKLDEILSTSECLYINFKSRHWNVYGDKFIALHEEFDKIADLMIEISDKCAERIVQLGDIPSHSFSQFIENSFIKQNEAILDWKNMCIESVSELDDLYKYILLSLDDFDETTQNVLLNFTEKIEFYKMVMSKMIK